MSDDSCGNSVNLQCRNTAYWQVTIRLFAGQATMRFQRLYHNRAACDSVSPIDVVIEQWTRCPGCSGKKLQTFHLPDGSGNFRRECSNCRGYGLACSGTLHSLSVHTVNLGDDAIATSPLLQPPDWYHQLAALAVVLGQLMLPNQADFLSRKLARFLRRQLATQHGDLATTLELFRSPDRRVGYQLEILVLARSATTQGWRAAPDQTAYESWPRILFVIEA